MERVGIVFPVYVWGMPRIVDRFISKIEFEDKPYIFGLMNYGGFGAATLEQLNKRLKEKEIELSAGFGIRMPGNYIPLYGADSIQKQKTTFEKAKLKIEEITKIILEKRKYKIEKSFWLLNFLFTNIIYNLGIKKMSEKDKNFWTNEKCNKCKLCINICPVNNIELKDDKIVWFHKCEQCMACIQWCPVEAIEFGKKTVNRKRYRHPDLKPSDFLL
ncbi:MAG TPA: EFR1 family ferrodoxin [bacterium]|nr:EFR1 family ferrodoxin [bacterium]HPQ17803.1 EFR1 family ferrodoxin [bacterium]